MSAEKSDLEHLLKTHLENDSRRLDRREQKIDLLSDTVVGLARVEEKIVGLDKELMRTNERLDKIELKLEDTEVSVVNSQVTVKAVNKVFWTVITAIIGAVAAFYLTK